MLDAVPEIVGYYSEGAAALAADFYDERRALAGVKSEYASELVINDRTVKIRRAVAWASSDGLTDAEADKRFAEIVQAEVSMPYRDTIVQNRRQDPASAGWRRITGTCCRFCRMLADRGAVYKQPTALFAAHPHCDCTAEPVFRGQVVGPEASAFQYAASRRGKTPKQKADLRAYLDANYPD